MPAKSAKQQKFMAICSHQRKKAQGKCPPQKVAEEFSHAPPKRGRKKDYYRV